MEAIIDLHHDIMFYLIIVIVIIIWMLVRIIYFYSADNIVMRRNIETHNDMLEVLWVIYPCIILVYITVPSFELLFMQATTFSEKADVTLKVSGNQ